MALQDYLANIGKTGKDTITGFTGTIVVASQASTGMVRYSLTPKVGKDGKYPDSIDLDVDRVKVSGKAAKLGFPSQVDVALGDGVESTVHKFAGIVTILTWHMNGCVIAFVEAEVTKEGKIPTKWCPVSELKVTKKQKLKVAGEADKPPGSAFGKSYNDSTCFR